MVANRLLELAEKDGISAIRVEHNVLRDAVNQILRDGHPRDTLDSLRFVYERSKGLDEGGETFVIRHGETEIDMKPAADGAAEQMVYTIYRSGRGG